MEHRNRKDRAGGQCLPLKSDSKHTSTSEEVIYGGYKIVLVNATLESIHLIVVRPDTCFRDI